MARVAPHGGNITVAEESRYGKGIGLHTMTRAALHACRIRNMGGGLIGGMARGAAGRDAGMVESNTGKGRRAVVAHAAILSCRCRRVRGCFDGKSNGLERGDMASITTYRSDVVVTKICGLSKRRGRHAMT